MREIFRREKVGQNGPLFLGVRILGVSIRREYFMRENFRREIRRDKVSQNGPFYTTQLQPLKLQISRLLRKLFDIRTKLSYNFMVFRKCISNRNEKKGKKIFI